MSSGGCDLLKGKSEKKAFAEACTQAADCESGECATYGSICTKGCTFDKDCGSGLVCRVKDVGTGNECSKPFGIAPGPSASCNAPSECQHAQCLRKVGDATGPGVCSKFCADVSDCPEGMKICESISDSGQLKMCLPGDPAAPAAEKPKFVAPKPKPVADAGAPDAGGTDAGTTGADAGTTGADAGTRPTLDGGATATDAGATATDAGTTVSDAGTRPDGGRPVIGDGGIRPKFSMPK